jgi:hypothetical protein
MTQPPRIKFGALLRQISTNLTGHYIRVAESRHIGPTYQVMDTYHDGTYSTGATTLYHPSDCEVLRAEPTSADIEQVNAALATYADIHCRFHIGNQVMSKGHTAHYHDHDEYHGPTRMIVTFVVPVFNDTMANSFRLRCTNPLQAEGNWIEADQCHFKHIP